MTQDIAVWGGARRAYLRHFYYPGSGVHETIVPSEGEGIPPMPLGFIFLAAPIFVVAASVARWAWRYQQRVLAVTGSGLARAAGRPGTVVDVQLTTALVDESQVLVGFRPAGVPNGHGPDRSGVAAGSSGSLLMAVDGDTQANLARLRRWEASGVMLVMWRDRRSGRVELTHMRSGQRVVLSVVTQPTPLAAPTLR